MINVQEQEEMDFAVASEGELDRADAALAGSQRRNQQWICSDRDVWYKNPYYVGPDQPHPEHDEYYGD